ncbi:MAG: two-component sensor histidine kinase [Bacteroidetes bacterium]|nr:MAG: two-component sensor histidine kinase [Bacteroidota bacterium]
MKNLTPNQIAISASAIISVLVLFMLLVLENYFVLNLPWFIIVIPPLVALVFGYAIVHYLIEKFIYRKIKLIYKHIHYLKSAKGSISKNIDLSENLIDSVEKEVTEWEEDRASEIEQLKKMEEFRKEFLGNVSHELKTPVFNLQGYIETLLEGGLKDDKINMEYLNKASKNIDRMNAVINDLEKISRIEHEKMDLEQVKFDVHELATEVFKSLEMRADLKAIRFSFKQDCDKPFMVLGDRSRIREVLVNLITNSLIYGKEGGNTLVGFYDMSENILIEVTDNGIGIEEKHISRLFERFYRVDKSRSREQGGTGLGLSIVKHIIEAHKQTITVRSTSDVGSTFGFTLQKA